MLYFYGIKQNAIHMNLRSVLSGSVFLIVLSALIVSCKKDPASGTMNLTMKADDAPYEEVNVYVKEMWANYSTKKTSTNWEKVDIRPGFYDLLHLSVLLEDTIIANSIALTEGQLTQLRLVFESDSCHLFELGDPDFVRQPMPLANTSVNGVKISVNRPIKGNAIMNLRLNVDTENSVLVDDEGAYQFDPQIEVDTVSYIEP